MTLPLVRCIKKLHCVILGENYAGILKLRLCRNIDEPMFLPRPKDNLH